jgi:hypothetical protein
MCGTFLVGEPRRAFEVVDGHDEGSYASRALDTYCGGIWCWVRRLDLAFGDWPRRYARKAVPRVHVCRRARPEMAAAHDARRMLDTNTASST